MPIHRATEVYHQLLFLSENRLDVPTTEHKQILKERGYSNDEINVGGLILFCSIGKKFDKLMAKKETQILIT